MFFVATVAILKFLSLKIMCTHVRQNFWKVPSNSEHHSKPTMNINSQHHNLLGNQISPKSEDFCIWRPFYTLVTMAMTAILIFFNPPKAATYYGGYSYKVDHNMAPKPWISIPNIKIYLEINFFVFWQPLWIQNGHHSKPTMNINSQHHHHLLGNQISSKSENFCIWRPICTLVTMATATILNLFKPPPKSCHPLRLIFLQSFMKFDERNQNGFFNPTFFVSMATGAKFVKPIPIFFLLISFH